jgi:hypothetical protein
MAVGLVLLIFGGCLLPGVIPFQIIYDDGMRECTFRFLVLDAKTKRPLQGVRIALYDDLTSKWQEIRTDQLEPLVQPFEPFDILC